MDEEFEGYEESCQSYAQDISRLISEMSSPENTRGTKHGALPVALAHVPHSQPLSQPLYVCCCPAPPPQPLCRGPTHCRDQGTQPLERAGSMCTSGGAAVVQQCTKETPSSSLFVCCGVKSPGAKHAAWPCRKASKLPPRHVWQGMMIHGCSIVETASPPSPLGNGNSCSNTLLMPRACDETLSGPSSACSTVTC